MSARFAVEGRPVYWSRLILSVGLCGALFLPVVWTAERPRNSGAPSSSETPASEVADQGTEISSEGAPKQQEAPVLEKGGTSPRPAPEFSFQDIGGTRHTLGEFTGHVVLLEFWASWCIPCRKGFPFLDGIQGKYEAAGLKVVAVTMETEDDAVTSFLAGFPGVRFLVGRDPSGKGGESFEVAAMPSAFLLDREGRLLARFEGGTDAVHQEIEAAVQGALRGELIVAPPPGAAQEPPRKGGLKAWERGYLADPIMNLDGDVLKRSMREHIFASKEGAAGDGGVAGGGCGCN